MDVHEANLQVLRGACVLRRCDQIKADPRLLRAVDEAVLARYTPAPMPADSIEQPPASLPMTLLEPVNASNVRSSDSTAVRRALLETQRDVVVELPGGGAGLVRAVPWSMLGSGSAAFMEQYGVKYPLYTGAMAKGIASAELVIAAGQRGMLASLGAGGLPLHRVTAALDKIQAALPNGPFAVNLIHAPADEGLESGGVELFLKRGVRVVEASAFMKLTPWVVRYRVAGLERGPGGRTVCRNKIIFKVSRTELAALAMRPPPADIVAKLLAQGLVTAEQAALAPTVTMCDDVTVEADSGGHTDNRHMPVLLPVILAQRDAVAKETGMRVRVGAGGGIGCPEAAAAAFAMGADFIVTGTINQMCRQSGTCDIVRKQLSEATYSDVVMAPAADMFEMGVDLQVLKKGTMFPARAKKLYELFVQYPSLEALPAEVKARLEKQVFRKPIQTIWDETVKFTLEQLKDPEKIARAERDPKLKMALVFRWYLGLSSAWANGGVADRALDYQVWCGPAIGAFNDFIRGTYLDPIVAGQFMDVHEANLQVLRGACVLRRCDQIKADPRLLRAVDEAVVSTRYEPEPFDQ
jgi:PfaD family protein